MKNDYEIALMKLNDEYKKIYNSNEYRIGKKFLKFNYYLKKGKIITLIKKIVNLKNKNYVYKKDNFNNVNIFKNNESNQIHNISKNEKIAIYTVNIGGYDNLIQPLIIEENIDYFIVSDKKPLHLGVWKWIDASEFLLNQELSNVKKARYIKTHPHLIFPQYKYSIFIDGNIRCVSSISSFCEKINKDTKMAIHPHPYRDCIYKEIISCRITRKGNYSVMKRQVDEYRLEGMPESFGLFETNVFVREHNDSKCIDLMEKWWQEIYKKSERDQLSFTYVLWKNGYSANDVGVIYDSIMNNPCVQVIDHLEEYEKENMDAEKNKMVNN